MTTSLALQGPVTLTFLSGKLRRAIVLQKVPVSKSEAQKAYLQKKLEK